MFVFQSIKGQKLVDWYSDIEFRDSSEFQFFRIDSNSIWNIDNPTIKDPFIKSKALFTDSNLYYQDNIKDCFYMRFLLNLSVSVFIIRFEHKYDFEKGSDGGLIEISFNNGKKWNNILRDSLFALEGHDFYNQKFPWFIDTLHAFNEIGFTGTITDYENSEISFNPYKDGYGSSIFQDSIGLIRFCILSDSISSNNTGWIISKMYFYWKLIHNVDESNSIFNDFNLIQYQENYFKIQTTIKVNSIEIFDLSGKKLRIVKHSNSFNLNGFPKGLYFIRINNSITKKIIKN